MILGKFAEAKYLQLDEALKVQFDRLLQQQDSDLADWLGYEAPAPSDFRVIVQLVLSYKRTVLVIN